MIPLCVDQGVGVIPWSPLARGRLTRDWEESTARSETDEFGKHLYQPDDRVIVERVAEIADGRSVPRAQVALAWMLGKHPFVVPLFGTTKLSHLEEDLRAADFTLTPDETAELEAKVSAFPVVGDRYDAMQQERVEY